MGSFNVQFKGTIKFNCNRMDEPGYSEPQYCSRTSL